MAFESLKSQRVKTIGTKYFFDNTTCDICGRTFSREKAHIVTRWDSGMRKKNYIVCKKCARNNTGVLNVVDTDKVLYGVAPVDNFLDFQKTSTDANDKFVWDLLEPLRRERIKI